MHCALFSHYVMTWWIAPHVRACETAGSVVFLDLRANRYSGMPIEAAPALRACIRNWPCRVASAPDPIDALGTACDAPTLLSTLLRSGYLVREPPPQVATDAPNLRRVQELEVNGAAATLDRTVVWRFMRAQIWARRRVHHSTLLSIATELGAHEHHSVPSIPLKECVSTFRRLRPYAFAARDQCLFHALALLHFLRSRGLTATWIIGVRTLPWAAHSWLQAGDDLLDATPEQVREYVPILWI